MHSRDSHGFRHSIAVFTLGRPADALRELYCSVVALSLAVSIPLPPYLVRCVYMHMYIFICMNRIWTYTHAHTYVLDHNHMYSMMHPFPVPHVQCHAAGDDA